MKENKFISNVSRLVDPIEVSNIHSVQSLTGSLPLKIQKKLIKSSAKKYPMMGFVVEPYSYYLAYEIKDLKKAEELIPENFELVKTKIYEKDSEKFYGIIGVFNAHTSGFWGLRVEFYIIAKNKDTDLISWIIVDYDTNTISYDPKNGIVGPNASGSIFTIDYDGVIHVDVNNFEKNRSLKLVSDIKNGKPVKLDERLWIEGNLSIGYGKDKTTKNTEVFSLTFQPEEFKEALLIPLDDCDIIQNNWFTDIVFEKPSAIICFPYSQHLLSDSPGNFTLIKNKDELADRVSQIDFDQLSVFSTKEIKMMMKIMFVLLFMINITLLTILILR